MQSKWKLKIILQFISKILKWLTSLVKKDTGHGSKYVDLAPTDKADDAGIYFDALSFATNNPNVSNIALTGPYGSGKSSIIKTFLTKYKKPVLHISLAAFLPEADESIAEDESNGKNNKKGGVSTQEIERSILQQMLYGADANSLPLSRFKRIQSPKWWTPFMSLYIFFGIFACWQLIQKRSKILEGNFFLPFDLTNWFNLLCFAVGFIFLWQVLHQIYIKSFGISLKSISLKDIEMTTDSADKESILNRHLDEIIYFFQSTKYDLVVIEDLDRFNNPDIFVTLREINGLINENAGVKRPIRFLYALRDNMFVNTDRTKFFEFIIPVIPIINSSNSIDKVIEQGERLALDERLDLQFLREVSRYLNDLRLIHNIFNEYAIYVANLETEGENILDANKLLAILIYKNVLPSDFEELHQEKGKLAEILKRHDEYVVNAEAGCKAQISELEQQISIAEKQLPSDLDELRKIYAMALISKIPAEFHCLILDDNQSIPFQNLSDRKDFDQILEQQSIKALHVNNNYRQNVDISTLQNEVNPRKTFQKRKGEIEHKSTEFKKNASKVIRELRTKITTLRVEKFNKIIRRNAKGTEELFDAFGDSRELVRFLVFEGFLDDTYYQYTSLFHSGRLSPNDNKFLIQIRGFNNPEPNFQIDNPKEVIAAMREDDFRQSFVLNKTLVDCMFSDATKYDVQISKLLEFISLNFDECRSFFTIYHERGEHTGKFMAALVDKWSGFVLATMGSPDGITHVARMIAHLPEVYLSKLKDKDAKFSEFISEKLSEILALNIDFEPARLKLLPLVTNDLSSIEPYPAIARLLSEEGLYQVSIENMEFIFRAVLGSNNLADLQIKHYSTVLKSKNAALIGKVENDFDHYFKIVLLGLDHNTEEDVSTIIRVLNHDEIESEYLEKFTEKQSAKLPSLDEIPPRLHATIFRLGKIEASWENCLAFVTSENFNAETLTTFLEQNATQAVLSSITIDNQDSAAPLRRFLVNNNNMEEDFYRIYVRTLPKQFKQFPEDIDPEKITILIEEQKITFSKSSFSRLKEHVDFQVLFIAKNIDGYFESKDQFALDDDFREKLLNSEITDERMLKIVEDMDLTLIAGLPSRASIIGELFHRSGADVSDLNAEAAQAVVTNVKPVTAQIALFKKCQQTLSDEQVWNTLHQLPRPFSEIEPGYRSPTIPNTGDNLELVKWLQERRIISSWKPTLFRDEIRIHPFRN